MNRRNRIRLACAVVVVGASGALAMQQAPSRPVNPPTSTDRISYAKEVLIELAVSDLERAMKFYGETLELERVEHIPELEWATYRTNIPGLTIGIGRQDTVKGSGTTSINLGVTDLDATRARLEAKGVKFPQPSMNIPGVVKLADFADPDGNRLRLAGPADKDDSGSSH